MDYLQPNFYHFSEDSIELANHAQTEVKNRLNLKVLDLGCGCGVVAIEFALKHKNVQEIHFVDIQQENIEFVRKNIRLLPKHIKVFTYNCSFSSLNLDIDFDIILSNPPYFEKNRGRRSSNINKQICRTFEHDSYNELVECFKRHSNKSTRSFLVLRDQKNLKGIKKINNAYIGELVFE